MKIKILFILVMLGNTVYGRDVELDKLIKQSTEKSHAIKASLENARAGQVVKDRSTKHWLPQVYVNAQSFFSNDPGAALFGKLSQREIENSDFVSDSLNNPSTTLYSKATLGLNFPLYEGGQKVAMNKGYSLLHESKVFEAQFMQKEIYVEIVKNYFNGLVYQEEKKDLEKLLSTMDSMINRYQVGRRENQLGFSGLLGMRGLKNKIAAILTENKTKAEAVTTALMELAGSSEVIKYADFKEILKLIDEYLHFKNEYIPSKKVQADILNAQGAKAFISAEKSRNLPRVGLFGENTIFNGDRGTGNGFSAGIYVNWNLFSSNDYGAGNEAVHKYQAAQSLAAANLQKEKIEFLALLNSLEAIKNSLKLIEESDAYLSEQTSISNELFRNGMLNALQYVEVISRRVDLIQAKSKAKEQLVMAQSELAKISNEETAYELK